MHLQRLAQRKVNISDGREKKMCFFFLRNCASVQLHILTRYSSAAATTTTTTTILLQVFSI